MVREWGNSKMAENFLLDDDEKRRQGLLTGPLAPPPPPVGGLAAPKVAMPSSGGIPAVAAPQINPHQAELNRLTDPTKESSKPGFQQIHNPFLRTLAGIGNVVGSAFAPGVTSMIPGTSLHHDVLVGNQQNELNQDALRQEKNAQSGHLNAETSALQHPPDKPASNEVELFQQDPKQLEDFYSKKADATPDKGVANPQAGYAQAIADALKNNRDPNTDPHVQAWRGAIEATQKESAGNRDDKAIAINQKLAMKQPLSPEEVAYKKAYDQYVKQNKVDPGVQRMQILVNGKPMDVIDPNNPENVIPMRTGEAIASHASRPQSIPFQADKSLTQAFTSGKPGEELNAFNTAIAHADLLGQAAGALANGDNRTLNSIRNKAKTEFGSADVTNFNTIAKIYTGEVTKAINGGHVTEGELHDVGATIPDNASPQQIVGAVKAFRQLMQSKVKTRHDQYDQGKKGKPNFGDTAPAPDNNDPLGIR
jgi:hypothetical protein